MKVAVRQRLYGNCGGRTWYVEEVIYGQTHQVYFDTQEEAVAYANDWKSNV